jgi:hypothetical protein
MDWEAVATQAVAQHAERARQLRGRWRPLALFRHWRDHHRSVRLETSPEPGYHVHASDWPIVASDSAASPEQTLESLRGLSNYYDAAMATLGRGDGS